MSICIGCKKSPSEIEEYVESWKENQDIYDSPDDLVRLDEGTYNPENGHFLCTDCYIKKGMPSSPLGWRAP